jgi:hypothetical protein
VPAPDRGQPVADERHQAGSGDREGLTDRARAGEGGAVRVSGKVASSPSMEPRGRGRNAAFARKVPVMEPFVRVQ